MEEKTLTQPVKTPFKRLLGGMLIAQSGQFMALMTPLMLLLVFKVMAIDPDHYTVSFGIVTGIGAIFALFANPLGGAISDRTSLKFGRRRTWILLGAVLGSLSLLGIAVSTKVWMVAVFWCLVQMFFNFEGAAATGLIPDQVEESKRGTMSGIVGLIVPFSSVIGMVIMTIMGKANLLTKYGTLAAIATISAIIGVAAVIEGRGVYIKEVKEKGKNKLSFGEFVSKVYPSPRKYPIFTWGWLTRFCISMAYCSGNYNTVMFIQRYHLSQDATSKTVTLLSVITMAFLATSSLIGGVLSDKFRKQKPFVVASAVVVGIGVVINIFAPSVTYVLISSVLTSFGYGIFLAVDMALIARILPNKEDAAKDFGIMNVANTIPQSIVPFLAPTLLAIGGWPFLFASLAIFAVLSALAVIPIPEMSPTPIEEAIEEQKNDFDDLNAEITKFIKEQI